MTIEKNSLIKLTDGKQYIVLETIEYKGKKYHYLIEKDSPMNLAFYEEVQGEEAALKPVAKEELEGVQLAFLKVMSQTIQEKHKNEA